MQAAYWVVAAGMGAALHIGKLPPALPVLEKTLSITLVQAGFLFNKPYVGQGYVLIQTERTHKIL